jgi:hypothetical protein
MILNARNNSFVLFFPPNFFNEEVKEKYKKYYKSLILPFDTIDDFMSSTIQQIDMPGWNMDLAQQTRQLGKRQEYKNAEPIVDLFKREFTITFKVADAFMNYWIFLENALNYLDFKNPNQTLEPFRLSFLNNEGYLVTSVIFNRPILKGQSDMKMSYSSVTPDFKTFTATFQYFNFDIEIDFD